MTQGIPVTYDPSLSHNGVAVAPQLGVQYTRFGAPSVSGYAMHGSQWVPGYMMAQPLTQVDDQVNSFIL